LIILRSLRDGVGSEESGKHLNRSKPFSVYAQPNSELVTSTIAESSKESSIPNVLLLQSSTQNSPIKLITALAHHISPGYWLRAQAAQITEVAGVKWLECSRPSSHAWPVECLVTHTTMESRQALG